MKNLKRRIDAQKKAYFDLYARLGYFVEEYDLTTAEITGVLFMLLFRYSVDINNLVSGPDNPPPSKETK